MIAPFEFALRLLLAIGIGILIGFERQWHHKTAGLRTNALVAAGAAAYVMLSLDLTEDGQGDPSRVIGQVVVGVGFIGAGVIMRHGLSVQGINTAATIWCSSAIGCFAGSGWFFETAFTGAAVLFVNVALRPVEHFLEQRKGGPKNREEEPL